MNFILEYLFFVKISYLMDFDLETSRLYIETKGKNQACSADITSVDFTEIFQTVAETALDFCRFHEK